MTNASRRLLFLLLIPILTACGPSKSAESAAKRYHLTGRVVSVDKANKSLMVDGDEIPGFMSAMEMPYTLKDTALLDKLQPGDQISADVVVREEESWLENISITGHVTPPQTQGALHIPAPSEVVPDFKLTNQSGQRISLARYRGKTLLVTFIYTRCPFPDYCPRMTAQFAEINRQLRANDGLYRHTHLLSISFDPAHDTPRVLRDYAISNASKGSPPAFDHWEFAVPSSADLPKLATFFGLTIAEDGGAITHSLSTAVIGPDGKIIKWYSGGDWQASDLIHDAEQATRASV
jgi:protein SCO1/2